MEKEKEKEKNIRIWRWICTWKKSGKIKEYDDNGNLKFEGEYLKGEKNGERKEYYWGKLEFDGIYSNGEKTEKEKNFMIMVN